MTMVLSRESDIQPCDPYSEIVFYIYLSKCTHSSERTHTHTHTHTVNTHRSSWGIVVVLKVERALYIHSAHQQTLPDRDSNSQPFVYESDSLPLGHDFPGCVPCSLIYSLIYHCKGWSYIYRRAMVIQCFWMSTMVKLCFWTFTVLQ